MSLDLPSKFFNKNLKNAKKKKIEHKNIYVSVNMYIHDPQLPTMSQGYTYLNLHIQVMGQRYTYLHLHIYYTI
jgi:hypothetical protein